MVRPPFFPFEAELGSGSPSAILPLASVTIDQVSSAISFALSPALNDNNTNRASASTATGACRPRRSISTRSDTSVYHVEAQASEWRFYPKSFWRIPGGRGRGLNSTE
jgi:hypothetical protein